MPPRKHRHPAAGSNSTPKRTQINVRLSDFGRELLDRVGDKLGMNVTHAVEYCIRKTAIEEGVWDAKPKAPPRATT